MKTSYNFESISKLPQELTTWTIYREERVLDSDESEDGEDENREEQLMDVISVEDSMGRFLGVSSEPVSCNSDHSDRVTQLLMQCMFSPLYWKPRKPRLIVMDDSISLGGLCLQEYGVTVLNKSSRVQSCVNRELASSSGVDGSDYVKSCMTCQRQGSSQLFSLCDGCQAVFFCSPHCQSLMATSDSHISHKNWCAQIKDIMASSKLSNVDFFSFSKETTSECFTDHLYRDFLSRLCVLGQGLWVREEPCADMISKPMFGELHSSCVDEPFVLEEGQKLTQPPALQAVPDLLSWNHYYEWRGFRPSSPIAILLQMPLTLYFIITKYLKDSLMPLCCKSQGKIINIHILGAEKEADYFPAFCELGYLFPAAKFHLIVIGPNVSQKVSGQKCSSKNVDLTCVSGLYHRVTTGCNPDIIIGFNAGLGAYHSWIKTILKIKEMKTPAFFTDFNKLSVMHSQHFLKNQLNGEVSHIELNPFHSPIRKYSSEHLIPSYSNAWIYDITFT